MKSKFKANILSQDSSNFQYIFASLFLCLLCFFIVLNFHSNKNNEKEKELISKIKENFKDTSLKENIEKALSKNPKSKNLEIFTTQDLFEKFLSDYKSKINLDLNYKNNVYSLYLSSRNMLSYEDKKMRLIAKEFLKNFSNFLYKINQRNRIALTILNYNKTPDFQFLQEIQNILEDRFKGKILVQKQFLEDKKNLQNKDIILQVNLL